MKIDWQERMREVLGFSSEGTLGAFGYPFPLKSLDNIQLRCDCGAVGVLTAAVAYCRYRVRSYSCSSCSAVVREKNLRPDYAARLDIRHEFSRERTLSVFGYEVPEKSTDMIVVNCGECREESTMICSEFFRRAHYLCKVCVGKRDFSKRQGRMFRARDDYWSVEENRNLQAQYARDQPHRSTNMKRLNADLGFQNTRIAGLKNRTKGETEILQYVQSLGFPEAKKQHFVRYEVDVFVETRSIGFEFNGLYWHSEKIVEKNYHRDKRLFFKERGIKLIQVWESEWYNRKTQVMGRIKSLLGGNTHRAFARKCSLVEVDKKTAVDFVNRLHIQPIRRTEFCVGLMFEGRLAACATFSQHHRGKAETILQRFVTEEGTTIVGGLSRITAYAAERLGTPLFSWCDLRWSDGNGYERAGWKPVHTLPPDYFYIKSGRVVSKQARSKKIVKTPEGMTERQHADREGFVRVFDCGKTKYQFDGARKVDTHDLPER